MDKKFIFPLSALIILILLWAFWGEGRNEGEEKWKELENTFDKVVLQKGEESLEIIKENDEWQIGTNQFIGDKDKIDKIIDVVRLKRTFELISDEPENVEKFGLTDDEKISLAVFEGEKMLRNLVIGKASATYSHTYVIIDSTGYVYQADGNFRNDVDQKQADIRDKKILSFNREEMVSLEIEADAGIKTTIIRVKEEPKPDIENTNSGIIEKNEKNEYWQDDQGNKLKESEVNDVVNTLSSLQCDSFLAGNVDSFKKKKAHRVIRVKTKGNEFVLSLYKNVSGKGDKATSSNRKSGFEISKYSSDRLNVPLAQLK